MNYERARYVILLPLVWACADAAAPRAGAPSNTIGAHSSSQARRGDHEFSTCPTEFPFR